MKNSTYHSISNHPRYVLWIAAYLLCAAAAATHADILAHNYPLRLEIESKASKEILLAIENIGRLQLLVNQTGYYCQGEWETYCPSEQIGYYYLYDEWYEGDWWGPIYGCGGTTGFYNPETDSSVPGDTNVCSGSRYEQKSCGNGLIAPESGGTASAVLSIKIDLQSIFNQYSKCAYFSATVLISPNTEDVNLTTPVEMPPLSGFVLRTDTPGLFRTLLLIREDQYPADLDHLVFAASYLSPRANPSDVKYSWSLSNLFQQTTHGFETNWKARYAYVPTTPLTVEGTSRGDLFYFNDFACVMDFIDTEFARCVVPVPELSNHVAVLVAMTYFSPDQNVMTVRLFNNRSQVVMSRKCGGPHGFFGIGSTDGGCQYYYPCVQEFMYDDDAIMNTDPITHVEIVVPRSVGKVIQCPYAFSAIVEFVSKSDQPQLDCTAYCRASRTCLGDEDICNTKPDCSDGSDENLCFGWQVIENSSIFSLDYGIVYNTTENKTLLAFDDCKLKAIRHFSNVVALARDSTVCVVYLPQHTAELLASPETFLVPSGSQYILYAKLDDIDEYRRLSSLAHCNNRGRIVAQSGGSSSCLCDEPALYFGNHCEHIRSISGSSNSFVLLFDNRTAANPEAVNLALLREAYKFYTLLSSCDTFFQAPPNLCAQCSVHGDSGEVNTFMDKLVFPAFRDSLSSYIRGHLQSSRPEDNVVGVTRSRQDFSSVPCSAASGVCTLLVPRAVSILTVKLSSDMSAWGADIPVTVNLAAGGARRSQAEYNVTCVQHKNMVNIVLEGCVRIVCVTALNGSDVVSIAPQVPAQIDQSSWCYSPPEVLVAVSFTPPALESAAVQNSEGTFVATLAAGVVLIVVAAIVLIGSIIHRAYEHVQLAEKLSLIESPDSRLKLFLTRTFRFVDHFHSRSRTQQTERITVGLAVGAFNVLIVGILVLLHHATSSSYSSNSVVFIEEYADSMCDASVIAPTAFRYALIEPDSSRECRQRAVVGEVGTPLFASGACVPLLDGFEGMSNVSVQGGSSEKSCNAAKPMLILSGSCVPISWLDDKAPQLTFVKISCSTVGSAARRMAAVRDVLDATGKPQKGIRPSEQETFSKQHWQLPNSNTPVKEYQYPQVHRRGMWYATSTSSCRFESIASKDSRSYVDGNRHAFVLSTMQSFEEPNEQYIIEKLSALELEALSAPYNLSSDFLDRFTMKNGDYPGGYLYNSFTNDTIQPDHPASGARAAENAVRYYGVRGSCADIGAYFNSNTKQGDGEGITIVMNLRATYETYGFAFAVADARQNLVLFESPLLNRLMEIQANGLPDTAWFDNYSVYSSLLVHGPEEVLYFMYANPEYDPTTGEKVESRVVKLRWNLRQLGLLSLFNGYWHNVVIKLRAENGLTKAQLMIDGTTSTSALGWNQCVPRRPMAMRALKTTEVFPAVSFDSERLTIGGVLFAGYFNGGIANLEFIPTNVPLNDLWFESSRAIREKNAINDIGFVVLGALLLAAAAAFLFLSCGTSGVELWEVRKKEHGEKRRASFTAYTRLWEKQPADPSGEPYAHVHWSQAKKILGLSSTDLTIFLDQLRYNFRSPSDELVRLLYIFSKCPSDPAVNDPPPTAAAWKAQLASLRESVLTIAMTAASDDEELREKESETAADAPVELGNPLALVVSQGFSHAAQERSVPSDKRGDKKKRRAKRKESDAAAVESGAADQQGGDVKFDNKKTQSRTGGANRRFDAQFAANQQVGSATVTLQYVSSVKDLVAPLITTLQSVYVWLSTLGSLPSGYVFRFQPLISFIALDWTVAFSGLPAQATPLVQIFCALSLFAFVLYYLQIDELSFAAVLCRYALRRDDLDAMLTGKRAHLYSDEIIKGISDPLDDFGKCDYFFSVPILSLRHSQRLDQFLLRSDAKCAENLQAQQSMTVNDEDGNTYTLTKNEPEFSKKKSPSCISVSSTTVATTELHELGEFCPYHKDQRLRLQQQTVVWPFVNRPSCCAVMNKNPCCVSVGPIYRCGFIHVNKEGKKSLCPYALCPKHFRTSVLGTILADLLLPTTQGVQEQGSAWLLSSVFLFFANVFYTPFLKTALMILACNPYFQCLFPTCWGANMDQTFVLAVYLSIAVVLFFGVGFPLSITLLLQRRSTMLREIFFAPEYESRFGDAETREVDEHEWARFVNVDNTALGTLYKSFEFKWLYVPPIILAWKVILLSPPVFLENGSLGQAIGVAVVEFSFGLFMFITAPSTNALVDWMYKLGCVHQMLFLGLHNVHVYLTYHHRGDLEGYMIATTIVYLVITLLVVVHAKLEPTIKALLEVRTLSNILTKLGMQYTEETGIFVTPSAEIEFFELDEDEDEPAMVEAVDDEVSDHHGQCTVQYLDAQQPESSSREPGNGSYANQHEMQQVDLETDV